MNQSVYNIIIHTNEGIDYHHATKINLPIKSMVVIDENLWIERLERSEADKILTACEAPGLNFSPVRQYTQMYSFVRSNPPNNFEWDSDGALQKLLALSRIIHPTTISYEYSAIVTKDQQNNITQIIPGPVAGPGSAAFISDTNRNWLTEKEGNQLRELFLAYQRKGIGHPVSSSLWYHEYCSWLFYIDVRWALLSTALESIIHTDYYSSTKQFYRRIPQLAKEVNIKISENEAKKFYKLRSGIVHSGLEQLNADDQRLYRIMEELLRNVISHAIVKPTFLAFLSNRDLIRSTWTLD